MKYISTRNKDNKVSPSEAIVRGLASDGGLFVPEEFPEITGAELESMEDMNYDERAAVVLSKFLTDFTYEELLSYTTAAYDKFSGDPCPLVALDECNYMLELWHGPTCAFKDMALTVLPYLLNAARKKIGEENKSLILVATSGDTGKAALEGFKDVENTSIIVFYPSDGVSDMQKLQMQTQEGDNVYVCAIKGNFDDAQKAVKTVFADAEAKAELLKKGYVLSSANSINWGRLAPQIAYYISSYVDLMSSGRIEYGDKINYVVPSGNFGNILAGYYAKRMGLPINKLYCASNVNNILTDFFTTGVYDINREFHKTMSPSMDILISSNLERLLYEITGRDDKCVAEMMSDLKEKGVYKINLNAIKKAVPEFSAGWVGEEETAESILNFYEMFDYVADPHTAVAIAVSGTIEDDTPTVIVSTANAYKFSTDVYEAMTGKRVEDAEMALMKLEAFTGECPPLPLLELRNKPVRFIDVIENDKIKQTILDNVK